MPGGGLALILRSGFALIAKRPGARYTHVYREAGRPARVVALDCGARRRR